MGDHLHVVQFSGGAGSWATARRVAERHGTDGLVLLFADTLIEDDDLYRFLDEAAENVGGRLVKIAEGRDPWAVFFDERFLGNARIDPCSKVLKRAFLRKWLDENADPEATTVYLGIDWSEVHRFERAKARWKPFRVEAPLCERPYLDKRDILRDLRAEGIRPPRLYGLGFPHNNCGGFCVKAGQAQFANLLRRFPDRYAYHERRELELRAHLGDELADGGGVLVRNVSILKDRRGGTPRPLTMREFRLRIEGAEAGQVGLFDADEWGGCGCGV